MPNPTIRPRASVRLRHMQKLMPRLKLANLMSLPEDNFGKLVRELENDPVFKRFMYAPTRDQKLFGYKRYAQSEVSSGFLELNEGITAQSGPSGDIEAYLDEKKELVALCQKIGMDDFRRYFLYNDENLPLGEIADRLGLTLAETQKAVDLVNHVMVEEHFQDAPTSNPQAQKRFSRIAALETEKDGQFMVKYNTLRYARGRYMIDYEKIAKLKSDPTFSRKDFRKLNKVVHMMELVNTRKSTVCQVLQNILERQKTFLSAKNQAPLQSFTQSELAKTIGVHCSTISRAIAEKTVVAPWGEEIPIRQFFVDGPIHEIKSVIKTILADEERQAQQGSIAQAYRDEEIRNILKSDHKVSIATRTVAKYRKELGVPNVYERQKYLEELKSSAEPSSPRL